MNATALFNMRYMYVINKIIILIVYNHLIKYVQKLVYEMHILCDKNVSE